MGETARVRFRHTAGDIGPLPVSTSSPVSSLKEQLLSAWPADGPLAAERPASAGEIRLIGAGKFLENSASLSTLPHVLGDPAADIVITLHVVLRKPQAAKPAAPKQQSEDSKGCCVIC
ncbi:hypothetical protein COHA_005442 [Chlorella ohadii]|uniref:UBL3-like ubiquitin domain-containing protein n=1 Tax=Chlorella ohadii TaxID=2649997 RepID=A0AAD5DN32_9CHLO|nr:hypothetical protein COHA_005442 [Chlorella ohadii]